MTKYSQPVVVNVKLNIPWSSFSSSKTDQLTFDHLLALWLLADHGEFHSALFMSLTMVDGGGGGQSPRPGPGTCRRLRISWADLAWVAGPDFASSGQTDVLADSVVLSSHLGLERNEPRTHTLQLVVGSTLSADNLSRLLKYDWLTDWLTDLLTDQMHFILGVWV